MLPRRTLNSVKERGSNGALRSHLFAKGRTSRGGSCRSLADKDDEVWKQLLHIL
jgi:hypothetical protein